MATADQWLLPDGVEEILPGRAWQLESLRRSLLDLYYSWGYDLVIPPLIEYLDSLLSGAGSDLDLQTFKVTDQLSGKLMGIRADITPQVARIDAHELKGEGPSRLCYASTVLHTHPASLAASRIPLQVGVELFGHSGFESDVEVLSLMLETLKLANYQQIHIDLGHVGIYRALVNAADLNKEQEFQLSEIYQGKAVTELKVFVAEQVKDKTVATMLIALADLAGGDEVLVQAKTILKDAPKATLESLANLESIASLIQLRFPELRLYYDLSELRGYHYHTGCVFAAYVPGQGQAIAKGGRYDHIGELFGRARPATGFSTDLKLLLTNLQPITKNNAIWAPCGNDQTLLEKIAELRKNGERVVVALSGQNDEIKIDCKRRLVKQDKLWVVDKT